MWHRLRRAHPVRIALVMLALVALDASGTSTFEPVLGGRPGLPRAVSLRKNFGGLAGNARGNDRAYAVMSAGVRPVWGGLLVLRGGKQTDKDPNKTQGPDSESEEVEDDTLGRGEEILPTR